LNAPKHTDPIGTTNRKKMRWYKVIFNEWQSQSTRQRGLFQKSILMPIPIGHKVGSLALKVCLYRTQHGGVGLLNVRN